jgi:hypothetical protein
MGKLHLPEGINAGLIASTSYENLNTRHAKANIFEMFR